MQVRLDDGRYVTRYTGPNDFDLGPRQKKALRSGGRALEDVLEISAVLRAQGYKATVTDDFGENREPVSYVAPVEHESIVWRGIRPKRITATMWGYVWRDFESGSTQSCTASSPLQVIAKLKEIEHPLYQRLRDSLPPENSVPAVPTFQQPVSASNSSNGRVLRPGSATYSLPERRAETAQVRQSVEFSKWVDGMSSAEMKERMKDPVFVEALNALPAKR